MNFTADYANDLLRKLEVTYRSEGKSVDFIYSDLQFAQDCQNELDSKKLEIEKINENASRYQVQFTNRLTEIENMRRCRNSMDEKVYRRLMDSAVRRRRNIQQRYAVAKSNSVRVMIRVKELEVLRYAQVSGLRRFWDHPVYKLGNLSADEFNDIVATFGSMVKTFYELDKSKLAA